MSSSTSIRLADGPFSVVVEPDAGGRLAQITTDGVDLLVNHAEHPGAEEITGWGCYPMVPWAGRIRHGTFRFGGRTHRVPINFGDHAIHGVGFQLPWTVVAADDRSTELRLEMPSDERWPFGGTAGQRISVVGGVVALELWVTADDHPFPVSLGWHPWFRKPTGLDFRPTAMYRRDDDGITVDELVDVPPGPWDDCFVNDQPVVVEIAGRALRLSSDCTTWVVYDERSYATCVEPQTAPPDSFNTRPDEVVEAGGTRSARFRIEVADPT